MANNIVDFIALDPTDEARYKEIITACAERKANAPKAPRAPRKKPTLEDQIASTAKRMEKLKAALAAAKAAQLADDTAEVPTMNAD